MASKEKIESKDMDVTHPVTHFSHLEQRYLYKTEWSPAGRPDFPVCTRKRGEKKTTNFDAISGGVCLLRRQEIGWRKYHLFQSSPNRWSILTLGQAERADQLIIKQNPFPLYSFQAYFSHSRPVLSLTLAIAKVASKCRNVCLLEFFPSPQVCLHIIASHIYMLIGNMFSKSWLLQKYPQWYQQLSRNTQVYRSP